MGKAKDAAALAGCLSAGVAFLLLQILGGIIHVWTIIIAYATKGLIAAVISAALPVLAQIYWSIKIWSLSGTFFNPFCLAISAYVVLWIIVMGAIAIFDS